MEATPPAAGAESEVAAKGAPAVAAGVVAVVAAGAPAAAPRRAQHSDNSANTVVLATLAADLQTIRSSPLFAGIEHVAPQDIEEKGFQHSFSAAAYENAMGNVQMYKAGVFCPELAFRPSTGRTIVPGPNRRVGHLLLLKASVGA